VITFPFSGLFWGNDSLHAELVARKMDQIGELLHDRSVMVWGGSSLPLAYSSANYSGRFLLPRFAEPPYQTDRTLEIFHREFEEHPPMLIVDLHERGDNLFDNPFESDPFILVHLESGYHLFIDPTLPWAKFYVRNPSVGLAALHLEAITGLENTQRVYSKFPTRESEWRFLGEDREHRVSDALELLSLQSQDPVVRNRAGELLREFKLSEAEAFLVTFKEPLLPLRSRLWWPEVAIVELQPKLFSGKK
jgi:hypothetical protein